MFTLHHPSRRSVTFACHRQRLRLLFSTLTATFASHHTPTQSIFQVHLPRSTSQPVLSVLSALFGPPFVMLKSPEKHPVSLDWFFFKVSQHRCHKLIFPFKRDITLRRGYSSSGNPRLRWQTMNKVLHRISSLAFSNSVRSLAVSFVHCLARLSVLLSSHLRSNNITRENNLP